MRIALFHTTLPEAGRKVGGVEVAVHRLANELVKLGSDEITVLSLSPRPPDALYHHDLLFPGQPWLKNSRMGRLFILPWLLNTVGMSGFDVLHLHGDDWFYFLRRKPTLRTLHGSALREAQTASSWRRRFSQYVVYPLEHLAAHLCSKAVAVGADTAALYRIHDLVDNGVDPAVFHPGPKAERPRILFVGTWLGRKRGKFLFDVFLREVLPQVPGAELSMVSDYCPLHPQVMAVDFPPDDVLARHFREAWVFALPSRYEGFGIPYLEAMASGTPVVCSPNDGAEHVLGQGRHGIVADDAAFGQHLVAVLTDRKRREELAAAGYERSKSFHWPLVAARHRQFYLELAGPAGAPARA